MKRFFLALFFISQACFAQDAASSSSARKSSSSAADSQIRCPEIEYHGMQTTKYIPNKPYIINWNRNTIDLDGIVDSIGLDTFFVDGKIPILLADSSNIAAKIARLKQVSISSTDNAMKNAFDSNYVYIPLTFNANKGDTISVHNYSASVFLDCSSQYTVPYGFFMGLFSNNPTSDVTSIKRFNYNRSNTTMQKHNRDASGKFLNRKTSKIIQY